MTHGHGLGRRTVPPELAGGSSCSFQAIEQNKDCHQQLQSLMVELKHRRSWGTSRITTTACRTGNTSQEGQG